MVDDLPHAAGPEARRRLTRALGELAATARFPVVVVAATEGGSSGGDRGGSDRGGGSSFMQGGLHKVPLSSALFLCLHCDLGGVYERYTNLKEWRRCYWSQSSASREVTLVNCSSVVVLMQLFITCR